jgi:hypothetical protein
LTRAQNVFGRVVAGQHVGVGHARHGDVTDSSRGGRAGVGRAHQPRGELVGEVAAQHAAFDQHRLLRRRAFVVHVERAAAAGDGAVVHHGDLGAGHRLADQPGKGRGLLAVEVGFEAVAHRLMQQDSRPAGAEHHFHLAGRSGHGAELQNRSARGLARQVSGLLEPVNCSSPARPPPPAEPLVVFASSLAMTKTLSRQSGWVSLAKAPSEAAIRMRRSSSE